MPRAVHLLILLISVPLALPVSGAYASRDLVLPVIGRSSGNGGRLFDTAVWITNLSSRRDAEVMLSFYQSGRSNPNPTTRTLRIGPGATYVTDQVDPALTGDAVMGAIRVVSSQDVIASARTFSRLEKQTNAQAVAAAFSAIPAQFAIGNGEETMLQGVTPHDTRYKIYLVEVTGQPLNVSVSLRDPAGLPIVEKGLYVGAHMQLAADLSDLIPPGLDHAVLRVAGTNGAGRIVVAAAQIATESQDASAYEMTFPTTPRNRMALGEVLAYVAVAAVILVAALRPRRVKDAR